MKGVLRWTGALLFTLFWMTLAYSFATEITARVSVGWLKVVALVAILVFALAINAATVFTVLTGQTKKHV